MPPPAAAAAASSTTAAAASSTTAAAASSTTVASAASTTTVAPAASEAAASAVRVCPGTVAQYRIGANWFVKYCADLGLNFNEEIIFILDEPPPAGTLQPTRIKGFYVWLNQVDGMTVSIFDNALKWGQSCLMAVRHV